VFEFLCWQLVDLSFELHFFCEERRFIHVAVHGFLEVYPFIETTRHNWFYAPLLRKRTQCDRAVRKGDEKKNESLPLKRIQNTTQRAWNDDDDDDDAGFHIAAQKTLPTCAEPKVR
jgi:hypothetical protein